MAWTLPWPRKALALAGSDPQGEDAWSRHVTTLAAHGIPEPGTAAADRPRRPATEADMQALYGVSPSFADLLPWVEYLPGSKSMLLEDGQSVAGFFELAPVGTEGREIAWLWQARDALENALQDSFDELDENPWVVQLYAQDESTWDNYLRGLADYVRPRALGSAFTDFYLRFFGHHLRAIAKREDICPSYARQILPLAFLAPDLVEAVLEGKQPPSLSLAALVAKPLPVLWDEQRALFATFS